MRGTGWSESPGFHACDGQGTGAEMADVKFLAAYLAVGADGLKRQVVLERLERRVGALGDLDFNEDAFLGSAAGADELVTACNTMPFACPYRLVVVKEADKLAKPVSDVLVSYLADPCESTIVLLDAEKLAKSSRLYKAVAKLGKHAVIDCAPKKARDLPAQVRDFAVSEGVTITPAAANELIGRVGDSTVRLDTELKKLAAAYGRGAVIDVPQVSRYVERSAEAKPWHLVDALSARDARKVAVLWARMEGQSAFGLLTMSANRIRELLVAKDLRAGGQRALASALGKPEWMVKNHIRWASGFSQGELERALVSAAALEARMKSGGDQRALFERWALQVCSR